MSAKSIAWVLLTLVGILVVGRVFFALFVSGFWFLFVVAALVGIGYIFYQASE
jgi:hypothetical protein